MKIPQLARYNGTVAKAYEFVENNIIEFPVNPFEIIKKFKWGLLTYEEMALQNKCTIEDICDCLGTDGYSIYNGTNYTIAYNNKIKSYGRINFTLAHEIGHIVLKHHKDFDVTEVIKNNFTKDEYKILENEANCFARNFLAPAPLVSKLNLLGVLFNLNAFFNITFTAATTRISFLKNDLYYLTEEQITDFNQKYQRRKQCNVCMTKNLNLNIKYCPLCGNKNLVLGDVFTMKEYNGININELHECPRCENYDIQSEDNYCKICGLNFKNECTSCGMELDSSARYCTQCGNVTTYFQAGILKDWKLSEYTDKEPVFQTSNADDLPF